jgi:hypothetical protein
MKLESQITNTQYRRSRHIGNHSSLIDNQSKRRSTPVENVRQITSFYAKQSQFYAFLTGKRRFHQKTNPIQTQFKANKANNKPNLTQNKPNQTQFGVLKYHNFYCILMMKKETNFISPVRRRHL